MTKTLKDFMEVYKPKSPDEQRFVDKHVTIKHADRNGNGDDVFKASNIKTTKRKEERHGYDAGEDEKVYEEVEELDELSTKTLDSYRSKARKEIIDADANDDTDTYNKRLKGYTNASKAVRKNFVKGVYEEAEELEEANGEVKFKHYTITSGTKMSGMGEGAPDHIEGHTGKMSKLGIEHKQGDDYGMTRRVTVTNNETGETTHHHVYQRYWEHGHAKPTVSVRNVGKPRAAQEKHHNVIKTYLSGKTKLKESAELDEAKNPQYIEVTHITGEKSKKPVHPDNAFKALNHYKSLRTTKSARIVSEENDDLDEAVEVSHQRYLRSHGKKAKGAGSFAFTHKEYGDAKGDDVHWANNASSFADAAKSAKKWAKENGHSRIFVMEGSEIKTSLSKEDIINRAIENYMPEDVANVTLEDRFTAKIVDVAEAHKNILLGLFNSLNEDNQQIMIESCNTREGIVQLLDFAIQNRGE